MFNNRYFFRPKNLPVFVGRVLLELIKARFNTEKSVDASLGRRKYFVRIARVDDVIYMGDTALDLDYIAETVNNPRRLYALKNSELVSLSVFNSETDKYYQLVLFENNRTPTIEISGIHMHRVLVDPLFIDAKNKVRTLRLRPFSRVLEICTGLGYTTYWLLRKNCRVDTIEISKEVLELATYNPWSEHLASEKVNLYLADASQLVQKLNPNTYDYVIHDPPRFRLAPELYSSEFYQSIFKLLRKGGKLFHYTGLPGQKRNKKIVEGIIQRLRNSGFVRLRFDPQAMGVIAQKPN